jgi:cytochrome c-type biogenesis protein CcmH/NrfG
MFQDDRPHPLGLVANPEWEVSLTRRAELYLADRARRDDPEREPSRMHVALAILASIVIALSLFSAVLI